MARCFTYMNSVSWLFLSFLLLYLRKLVSQGQMDCSRSQIISDRVRLLNFVSKVHYTMVPIIQQERQKHTQLRTTQNKNHDKYYTRGVSALLQEHKEGSCSFCQCLGHSWKASQRSWHLGQALKVNGEKHARQRHTNKCIVGQRNSLWSHRAGNR